MARLMELLRLHTGQALRLISGGALLACIPLRSLRGVMIAGFSLAAFALAWLSISGMGNLVLYIRDRHALSAWYRKFEASSEGTKEHEEGEEGRGIRKWREYLPLLICLLLAFLMREAPLMAIYIAGVGVHFSRRGKGSEEKHATEKMYRVVERFTSAYKLGGSIFQILEGVTERMGDGPLRRALRRTIDAYYVGGRTPQQVLKRLAEEVDDYYLGQFVFILSNGISATREVMIKALSNLLERMRHQRALQAETKTALVLLQGECNFLGAACLVVAVMTVVIPSFRDFYARDCFHQLLWCSLTLVAIVAWSYFHSRVARLKEQTL